MRGFRLQKLEMFNWGTFDSSNGQVYVVRPEGETTLLIGQNGSGKSTLVDALLTLLVKPSIRNFNVAAGGKKRERSERTYILGAYDRATSESGGIVVKYLRPKIKQPAVILATFHNDDSNKSFTIAQVLYLGADQSVEKIYCQADGERSIDEIVSQIASTEGILKTIKEQGFSATKTFAEAEHWFARATGIKAKAMEVFNQTVAVRDVQRLNDFIRNHMLEPKNWSEKVDQLLEHFRQLNEAHRSLVKVRQQSELLEPVAVAGQDWVERTGELSSAEAVLSAMGAFFSDRIVELFEPESVRLRERLESMQASMEALTAEIEELEEKRRTLKNDIEDAGGERLRQIASLIQTEKTREATKKQARSEYAEALQRAGVEQSVDKEVDFLDVLDALPARAHELDQTITKTQERHQRLIVEREALRERRRDNERELEVLGTRRDSLPAWCITLRRQLCEELGLSEGSLPFVGELVGIRSEAGDWAPAIESVLHEFALSLLVPERHHSLVSRHIDETQMVDGDGTGRRLTYLVVDESTDETAASEPAADSLLMKLHYRRDHPLVPWVRAQIHSRFDYRCCEDLDTFRAHAGPALLRTRHLKSGDRAHRHVKDDRPQASDPRHFVLGWDNREKRRRIEVEIKRLQDEETALQARIDEVGAEVAQASAQRMRLDDIKRFRTFGDIDPSPHTAEIKSLEKERKDFEKGSDVVKNLRAQLARVEASRRASSEKRDELVGTIRELKARAREAEKRVAGARQDLHKRAQEGTLEEHTKHFEAVEAALRASDESPLTLDNLFDRREAFRESHNKRVVKLREDLKPIEGRLTSAMAQFLRHAPEEASDLRADPLYLGSYVALRERIRHDDLPRHEHRFKERLNEKVIHEIGLFRAALEQERRAIEEKIGVLNESLRRLEYRPGEFLELQCRRVTDREIVDFQEQLLECLDESFEDSQEGNEARFARIRELIDKLSDENNRRWRDKVIDVRRWLDFIANVVDAKSNELVSSYDDSAGQSGGEKAKLAFTILVAAIAYQYDIDPEAETSDRFHFVVVDEMFAKVDDQYAEYALELFAHFGLQLLIVAPLDAKARVTQPYVGRYLHVNKRNHRSEVFQMTAREFQEQLAGGDAAAGAGS